MPTAVILGAQWGDEGKGKVVDLVCADTDWVVRYQGGPNAGHTIVRNTPDGPQKLVFHHIPSGILHPRPRCLLGPGMVIDPATLLDELAQIAGHGFDVTPDRLAIDLDAHLILPIHRALDSARESGSGAIGTTKRGVGPCYEDRVSRRGIRVRDLLKGDDLKSKITDLYAERNALLTHYECETVSASETLEQLKQVSAQLAPYFNEGVQSLQSAVDADQRILFEGAQGALLDIAFGTYPFVTSSYTCTGGVFVGSGLAPHRLGHVLGITKAYTTRVGKGPFPTELLDETGAFLAKQGNEFGATTGRPRRCGWLDLVALKYAVQRCSITRLAVTKLDVLSSLSTIGLGVAYRHPDSGKTNDTFPADADILERVEPVIDEVPGWQCELTAGQTRAQLPEQAQMLLRHIENFVDVPVVLVSIGPARAESLTLQEPLWG